MHACMYVCMYVCMCKNVRLVQHLQFPPSVCPLTPSQSVSSQLTENMLDIDDRASRINCIGIYFYRAIRCRGSKTTANSKCLFKGVSKDTSKA